jgi:hypothetical protein
VRPGAAPDGTGHRPLGGCEAIRPHQRHLHVRQGQCPDRRTRSPGGPYRTAALPVDASRTHPSSRPQPGTAAVNRCGRARRMASTPLHQPGLPPPVCSSPRTASDTGASGESSRRVKEAAVQVFSRASHLQPPASPAERRGCGTRGRTTPSLDTQRCFRALGALACSRRLAARASATTRKRKRLLRVLRLGAANLTYGRSGLLLRESRASLAGLVSRPLATRFMSSPCT